MNNRYYYETAFELLMDEALNDLSPKAFRGFIDTIYMILQDYEEDNNEKIDT